MRRFQIQREMDDEPVYICDDATDPDDKAHEVVTIAPHYGTPQFRATLAKRFVEIMAEMAAAGDEHMA